ncbi:MAG: hypothetical protein ABIO72_05200 [Patescibacteria group bacterium]
MMSEKPKSPSERLRINGLNTGEEKPKPKTESKLKGSGLNIGKEKPKPEHITSGEELMGRVLIQRDSGDPYRVVLYNEVKRVVQLKKLGSEKTVTVGLELDDLLRKLQTEGSPWKLE